MRAEDRSIKAGDAGASIENLTTTDSRDAGPVTLFEHAWDRGDEPPRIADYLTLAGPDRAALLVELGRLDMKNRLRKTGRILPVDYYLEHAPKPPADEALDLIVHHFAARLQHGAKVTPAEYIEKFSNCGPILKRRFAMILDGKAAAEKPGLCVPEAVSGRPARVIARDAFPGFPTSLARIFEPLRKLGQGAMGVVWQCEDTRRGTDMAVKVIHASLARDFFSRERFVREAMAMGRLVKHPHAVAVHEVHMGEDPYIAMEYLRGRPLNEELKLRAPLPLGRAARIIWQLCDVLEHAHEQNIIHRDLKPSNLMLVDGDTPDHVNLKVLDFGLAKFSEATDQTTLTEPGARLGTLMYMSPEQVRNPSTVGASSDLYSVGLILYEMLTGCRPFLVQDINKLMGEIANSPIPRFSVRNPKLNLPVSVENFVLGCLEKDPALRPSSARLLAEGLIRSLPGEVAATVRWRGSSKSGR
jgi:hypothetical protein